MNIVLVLAVIVLWLVQEPAGASHSQSSEPTRSSGEIGNSGQPRSPAVLADFRRARTAQVNVNLTASLIGETPGKKEMQLDTAFMEKPFGESLTTMLGVAGLTSAGQGAPELAIEVTAHLRILDQGLRFALAPGRHISEAGQARWFTSRLYGEISGKTLGGALYGVKFDRSIDLESTLFGAGSVSVPVALISQDCFRQVFWRRRSFPEALVRFVGEIWGFMPLHEARMRDAPHESGTERGVLQRVVRDTTDDGVNVGFLAEQELPKALGRAPTEVLGEVLAKPDTDIKLAAVVATALGSRNSGAAHEVLLSSLQSGAATVRAASIVALVSAAYPEALAAVAAASQDKDEGVRHAAVGILPGALRNTVAVDDQAPGVADPPSQSAKNPSRDRAASVALQILTAGLRDASAIVREGSLDALAAPTVSMIIGSDKVVEMLGSALGDPAGSVRRSSIRELEKFAAEGHASAGEALIKALDGKEDRPDVCRALGRARIRLAVEPLISLLRDPQRDVKWAAAFALGQIGDDRAVEPLIEALRDKRVRDAAAEALKSIVPGGPKDTDRAGWQAWWRERRRQ